MHYSSFVKLFFIFFLNKTVSQINESFFIIILGGMKNTKEKKKIIPQIQILSLTKGST